MIYFLFNINSCSGVRVGGQTDGYSAEELEAVPSLYNGNNQKSGKKIGFTPGQRQEKRLWKHHLRELLGSSFCVVLLQLRFPRLSQMDLVITP